MVSKVRNFWLCVFSGVVATTLMKKLGKMFSIKLGKFEKSWKIKEGALKNKGGGAAV